jgi:hypothetical protein
MDRRKFNKGTKGNKGGARLSEKEKVWHKEKWEEDSRVRELESKIASGVYSVKDVYLLKALKADTVILKNMADKVLATLIDHTTKGDKFDLLSSEELTERLDNARKGKN